MAMHSASYQVTLPRACALTCGFADVLLMPDYSVDFALITCFGTQGYDRAHGMLSQYNPDDELEEI